MKLIKIILGVFITMVLMFIPKTIKALENRLTKIDSGWWYDRTYQNKHVSLIWYQYYFGDRVAYCIEPGVIEGNDYNIGDWNNSKLPNDLKEKMLLIAYYGQEYPEHSTNTKYAAAAQALIWETMGATNIKFSTGQWLTGNLIDVTLEKQRIMNFVNHHYDKPSFNGKEFTVEKNDTLTINDDNNILNNYEILDSDNSQVQIIGNSLNITPNKYGNIEIKLRKKQYTNKQYIVYYGDNVQTLLSGGAIDPVVASIKINVPVKAKLKVVKKDKETGKTIARSGINFKIKNLETNEYICQNKNCEYQTNNEGYLVTNEPLTKGRYQLEEVDEIIDGYLWNKESLPFEINENSELVNSPYGIVYEVNFSNQAVKGKVIINKKGEESDLTDNGFIYNKVPLEGVKFGLFAHEDIYNSLGELIYKSDTKITELITDENGYASIDNLYLGKYYVQEIETVENHILDNKKHYFELKYKDQYTPIINYELNVENYLPKGELDFTKIDFSDDKPLPNTLIEIYTESNELIFTGRTNENGKIIIKNLPIGKYYILEKEAPEGYLLNDEKMKFEIKEDGEIVKATMSNEKIIEVPNTLSNDYSNIFLIALIIIGTGIFGYGLYRTKKKKNK